MNHAIILERENTKEYQRTFHPSVVGNLEHFFSTLFFEPIEYSTLSAL